VILPFTVLRRLDCVLEPSNIWILSNRKPAERKGKELGPEHIEEITRLFGNFEQAEHNGKPIN
jgi:type I restriction enzyme M protein